MMTNHTGGERTPAPCDCVPVFVHVCSVKFSITVVNVPLLSTGQEGLFESLHIRKTRNHIYPHASDPPSNLPLGRVGVVGGAPRAALSPPATLLLSSESPASFQ